MKTQFTRLVSRAFAATLLVAPLLARAAASQPADPAGAMLAATGSIPVSSVSRHVEKGTFRVQVGAKLGRPDAVLPDGTWLYDGRRVADSEATGTLVVRFDRNRVNAMALVTRATATALIERARSGQPDAILATK